MKRLFGFAIVLACAFVLMAGPASANVLCAWTNPTQDVDNNPLPAGYAAGARTKIFTGSSAPPSTLAGTTTTGGATSLVVVMTNGAVGTTTYFGAVSDWPSDPAGAPASAMSNVIAYVWPPSAPKPPVLNSITKQ